MIRRTSRPPPRISRVVVEHRRPPNARLRPRHIEFIQALPCCVCGRPAPSVAAHIRSGLPADAEKGGTGLRPADRFTIPLCDNIYWPPPEACHNYQHRIGELTFWAELGVDPLNLSLKLWNVTGDLDAGLRLVLRTQQSIALRRHALREE